MLLSYLNDRNTEPEMVFTVQILLRKNKGGSYPL